MSKLSDQIAAAQGSADAAAARVIADVDALKAQIVALQTLVDAGGATQEDLDALAKLQKTLDGIDPSNPAVLPQ